MHEQLNKKVTLYKVIILQDKPKQNFYRNKIRNTAIFPFSVKIIEVIRQPIFVVNLFI